MKKEYTLVLIGAVLGGSFWFCAQLGAGSAVMQMNLWVVPTAIFGALAAAFGGVYLQSEIDPSDDEKSGKVIATAAMAAIAFPSMISSPLAFSEANVAAEEKQKNEQIAENAQEAVADQKIAIESDKDLSAEELAALANEVESLKEQSEEANLTVDVASKIDSDLKKLLDPLAERAKAKPGEAQKIAEIMTKIGVDEEASSTLTKVKANLDKIEEEGPQEAKDAAAKEKQKIADTYLSDELVNW